jgi:hypothetical protein
MTDQDIFNIAQDCRIYSEEGDDCLTCRGVSLIEFAREMFKRGQQEEIRRQKTGIGYVNGTLFLEEF